jgi:hypothetical protein
MTWQYSKNVPGKAFIKGYGYQEPGRPCITEGKFQDLRVLRLKMRGQHHRSSARTGVDIPDEILRIPFLLQLQLYMLEYLPHYPRFL